MFFSKAKGKITIEIDKSHDKLNSLMQVKGLAREDDVLLTTLFMHFVQQAHKMGKDPLQIVEKNLLHNIDKKDN